MRLLGNKIPGRQSGVALAVSLIILLIMTILGVQALNTTMLEEKMAGNYRDNQLAFEAAEAALRAGEASLDAYLVPPKPSTTGADGVWTFSTGMEKNIRVDDWWTENGVSASTNISQLSSQPAYIIMEQQSISDDAEVGANAQEPRRYFYRVVARGVGGSSNSVVLLQTTYVRLY